MNKMESESGTMLPEKVTSTASESRKTSKPIMEKRRRARINASLAELKSLLLEVMKKEGSRQNKMEKADILEITVNHLRQLQKQQFSALAASDPSLINKYRLGFNECANEVGKILGSMEGVDTEARAKLLGHLANCMVSSDIGNTNKLPPPAPETHVDDFSEKCNRKPMHFHMNPINSSPTVASQTSGRSVVGMETMLTLPPQEQVVTSTVSSGVMTIPSGHIPITNVSTGQHLQQQSQQHTIQQPVIQPPSQQIQTQQVQMPKLVSGVQVIPTKMPTGEMAFIIPANFLTSGQTPNYMIPVLPSQNVPTAHAQFSTATVAPVTVVQTSVVKTDSSLPNLSVNASSITLLDSKPILSICRNNNLVSETGLSNSNTSPQKISEGTLFENVHTSSSQLNILPTQEAGRRTNDNNSNHHAMFQPKDDSMWRPW